MVLKSFKYFEFAYIIPKKLLIAGVHLDEKHKCILVSFTNALVKMKGLAEAVFGGMMILNF